MVLIELPHLFINIPSYSRSQNRSLKLGWSHARLSETTLRSESLIPPATETQLQSRSLHAWLLLSFEMFPLIFPHASPWMDVLLADPPNRLLSDMLRYVNRLGMSRVVDPEIFEGCVLWALCRTLSNSHVSRTLAHLSNLISSACHIHPAFYPTYPHSMPCSFISGHLPMLFFITCLFPLLLLNNNFLIFQDSGLCTVMT